jgi:hypothetical protein
MLMKFSSLVTMKRRKYFNLIKIAFSDVSEGQCAKAVAQWWNPCLVISCSRVRFQPRLPARGRRKCEKKVLFFGESDHGSR